MKCIIGILFFAFAATQLISTALPVRSGGMVFYQPSSDYYNAHRAFVMQYASQPIRPYRRQGQAAVVNAYASGKKIRTGTFVGQNEYDNQDAQLPEDQNVHSVAEAGRPEEGHEEHHDEEEEFEQQPEVPAIAHDVPSENPSADTPIKKVPTHADEEDEDDELEEAIPAKKSSKGSSGITYFPVSFGSTNGGAIAIANSYSTGKGGTASSRATAYGSPAKSKATSKKGKE